MLLNKTKRTRTSAQPTERRSGQRKNVKNKKVLYYNMVSCPLFVSLSWPYFAMKAPECRMYAERFPEIDQVVMVQVNTLVILLASYFECCEIGQKHSRNGCLRSATGIWQHWRHDFVVRTDQKTYSFSFEAHKGRICTAAFSRKIILSLLPGR